MTHEMECDVLVIGSGAAGLSAAIRAQSLGLSVVVCEKEPVIGGTTARSGGYLWIPANSHAAAAGLSDDPQTAIRYIAGEAGNHFDAARVERFVAAAPRMVDWFEANTHLRFALGRNFADYNSEADGALPEGRSIYAEPLDARRLGPDIQRLARPYPEMLIYGMAVGSGMELKHFMRATRSPGSALFVARRIAAYLADLLRHGRGMRLTGGQALAARLFLTARERGIPILTDAPAVELLRDATGRVNGARIGGADPRVIHARHGVVLAAGGFPRDIARRRDLYPHHPGPDEHQTMAPPANIGDGVRLAEACGAAMADVSDSGAWTPVSRVRRKDGTVVGYPHLIDRGKPGIIAVDVDGERFVNESASYHEVARALIGLTAKGKPARGFLIADKRAIRRYGLGVAKPLFWSRYAKQRSGYLTRANSIPELAAALQMPAGPLVRTIERFNADARSGADTAFGKGSSRYNRFQGDPDHTPNPCLAAIDKAPFYAVAILPGDLGTFAGLAATPETEVLDTDGQVIRGLYVAGNDMGSVFGGAYVGGGATLGPAMTFGMMAAEAIAAQAKR